MKKTALTKFDRLMVAAAFAEEGEFETAREFMREESNVDKMQSAAPVTGDGNISYKNNSDQEKTLSTTKQKAKRKPVVMMILTGTISIGLYGVLLLNQDFLNSNFSKGGLFAFLPIITAFIFSLIHGIFTGHFWTVLGIEASKKKTEVK